MELNNWTKKQILRFGIGETACFCLLAVVQSAFGNPIGGSVAAGSASIVNKGNTTTITQTTSKAIINWKDFSINTNETTQFVQPSSSSVTLNRVTGGNPSQILGSLKANGTIYLLNPDGILFGKNAQVNVGGLVASTSQLSNSDFMSGNAQNFTPSTDPNASIINEGHISIKNAGLAMLVSPKVENDGVIEANLGTVVIASADHFTVDLYGDNLITLDAGAMKSAGQLINSGKIIANGGSVLLTAQAADSLLQNEINMNGIIEAKSVSTKNGKVVLQGYDNSTINVSGTIDVSGNAKGETGGLIQLSADTINLQNNTVLDAGGYAGGGNINIGSDVFHGPNNNLSVNTQGLPASLRPAEYIYADSDVNIDADSYDSGNAGNVVVWSENSTQFYGSISAAAKGLTGNGGQIETSGAYLDINGISVNTSSVNGKSGMWLLDPENVTIENASDSQTFATPYVPTHSDSIINQATLNTALAAGSVVITTGTTGTDAGDVTFANTVTIAAGANSLSVFAAHDIIFTSTLATALSTTTGTITLRADADQNGTGTLTLPASPGTSYIQATGATGVINYYYNPTTFGTPNANVATSITAATAGNATGYMLINDPSVIAGRSLNTLAGLSSDWAAGDNYALNQDQQAISLTNGPIGTTAHPFAGIFTGLTPLFSGNNQANITGLTITAAANNVGLFGYVSGATLSNIEMTSPTISGGSFNDIGAIAGDISNATTLTGLFTVSGGSVTGANNVGGLIGEALSSSSSAPVTISGSQDFTLTGSATISGRNDAGGLIGEIGDYVIFTRTGNVSTASTTKVTSPSTGSTDIGGLFGIITGNTVGTNDFNPTSLINNASLTVTNAHTMLGGIAGAFAKAGLTINSTMTNNATGTIAHSGAGNPGTAGGIFGTVTGNSTFTGNLTNNATIGGGFGGGTQIGGLIGALTTGSFQGLLTNNGGVTGGSGSTNMGGLIGNMTGGTLSGVTLSNTGSIGVALSVDVGGLIGSMSGGTINAVNLQDNSGSILANNTAGGLIADLTGGIFDPTGTLSTNSGISITSTGTAVGGLFGQVLSTVSSFAPTGLLINRANVTLTNAGVIGGIFGTFGMSNITLSCDMTNSGTIKGLHATNGVGGITGNLAGISGAPITLTGNLTNSGNIDGGGNTGGLFGQTQYVTFSQDINHVIEITGSSYINGTSATGGLIGVMNTGTLFNAAGNVQTTNGSIQVNTSGNMAGGLFGYIEGGSINSTVTFINSAQISGGADVGGIIGRSDISISNSLTNLQDIYGDSNVGGDIGLLNGATASGALSSTNYMSSEQYAGGLVGELNNASLSGTLLFVGISSGILGSGGLVGEMLGNSSVALGNATFIGTFSGNSNLGGVVSIASGTPSFTGTFTNAGGITVPVVATNVGSIIGELMAPTVGSTTLSGVFVNATPLTAEKSSNVGGIIGLVDDSTITASMTNNAAIYGKNNTGGIIGVAQNGSTVSGTLMGSGDVAGSTNVGGLIGLADNSVIEGANNIYSGVVTGVTDTGGIIGTMQNGSSLIHAGLTGSVSGTTNTGGIVGDLDNSTINQAYDNAASLTGVNATGGIAGLLSTDALVMNTLFGGAISASGSDMGGIVGFNNGGTVNESLSVGTFNLGATVVGALIGDNAGTMTSSFYDTRAYSESVGSGTAGGVGSDNSVVLAGPTLYTNAGWDFSTIWNTSPGNYPVLRFCTSGCTVPLRDYPPPSPVPPTPGFDASLWQITQTQIVNAQLNNIPSFQLPTVKNQENLVNMNYILFYYQNNPSIAAKLKLLPSGIIEQTYLWYTADVIDLILSKDNQGALNQVDGILDALIAYYKPHY